MNKYQKKLIRSIIILLAVAFIPSICFSQAKVGTTGANFLELSNSPRVNALGGCGINLIDEQSAFHNPATLGLFHIEKSYAVSIPIRTRIPIDIKFISCGFSFCIPPRLKTTEFGFPNGIYQAVAYSFNRLKASGILRTDYYYEHGIDMNGAPQYFTAGDVSHALSYSFGVKTNKIKFGFGLTAKTIKETLETESAFGYGFDFGAIADIAIIDRFSSMNHDNDNYQNLSASFAIVFANIGPRMKFLEKRFPLPHSGKLGLSLCYKYRNIHRTILSVQPMVQIDNLIVTAGYRINRLGLETGVGDILFLRIGQALESDNIDWGFGLSIMDFVRVVSSDETASKDESFIDYLKNNMDMTFDFARAKRFALEPTSYFKLTLSF